MTSVLSILCSGKLLNVVPDLNKIRNRQALVWRMTSNVEDVLILDVRLMLLVYARWGIITGPPSAEWQNFVTMLFFSIKIPTTKHEIILLPKGGSRTSTNCVRVSWQLGTNCRISPLLIRQSNSGACVFVRVLMRKEDTLNTIWAISLKCCCCL